MIPITSQKYDLIDSVQLWSADEFTNGSFLAPCLGNLSLNYDMLVFISIKKLFKTWLESIADDYGEVFG